MDKDTRKILKELEAQGFTVRRTKKGHHQVSLDGKVVVVFAGTASDWRSTRNGLARAKRAGFKWPPPK